MTRYSPSAETLATALNDLREHTARIWQQYQQAGPGRMAAEMFDAVEAAAERCDQLLQDSQASAALLPAGVDAGRLGKALRQARDLAHRCACTPRGLCFISGEAGLIPRRDQHDAFEQALRELGQSIQQLREPH